eukprot:TRINITY_DN10878_c1_g1_i1.p1 TRINITY_DN10878_c1_g1~~TRINITY_DN10878_c1_g1_i1.p1  ORF type:complete len:115 (-),score=4.94 TRINITY_DN10878_c1_g1_i1:436-744(-)
MGSLSKDAGAQKFILRLNTVELHASVQGIIDDTAAFHSRRTPNTSSSYNRLLCDTGRRGCARSSAVLPAMQSIKASCSHAFVLLAMAPLGSRESHDLELPYE